MMAVCSFAHCEAALSLQAAYSDYQIGAFENFHQPVEDTLIILRPGPKVVFQYELRFVNRLKSQLLISHHFLPIKQMPSREKRKQEIKLLLGNIPTFLSYLINFYFNARSSAHDRGGFIVQPRLPKSTDWILSAVAATLCAFLAAAAKSLRYSLASTKFVVGTFRTSTFELMMSTHRGRADIAVARAQVRK